MRARSVSPTDRLQGVVGYVLKRAGPDDKPNCWAAYGQELDHGGVIYDSESLARYTAERDWPCVRDIQLEAGELRKKLKATRIPFADSDDEMILVTDERAYHRDEALEYLIDEGATWIHGTDESTFNFDIEEALDDHLADSFEDAPDHVVDREGLRTFWKQWCDKQSLTGYFEDSSRILVIDPAGFEREVREWTERLALLDGALARIATEGPPATHLLFVCTLVCDWARHLKRNWDHWPYVKRYQTALSP